MYSPGGEEGVSSLFLYLLCASARFTLNRKSRVGERQVRGAFVSSARHTWEHNRDLVHLLIFVACAVKAGDSGLQH